ncbi:hypothetical protein F4554_004111 [Actinopolymorpha rutila]|uniref:Uncharacterized protein n=1 Tax=Actinopolymorpha rutila TaxID=446787 RepID=A0A852ZGQ6_9ACTN|nr:hypothetical protein [Actinopolymorpha rutila]
MRMMDHHSTGRAWASVIVLVVLVGLLFYAAWYFAGGVHM